MKILYYNWTPLHVQRVGGGVAVYLENLITSLATTGGDITVLTSGYYYDNSSSLYIKKDVDETLCKSYTLVNSPAPAPLGIVSPKVLQKIMADTQCKDLIYNFIKEHGPFDVIHFQTLEGISPNVLSLKEEFPHTRFIHSIHDYGLFCPNVKFWNARDENCVTVGTKENCRACMLSAESLPLSHYLSDRNRKRSKLYNFFFQKIWGINRKLRKCFISKAAIDRYNSIYQAYRSFCVEKINKYIDVELAVSKRVKDIASIYGIKSEKIKVSYIGTKVAEKALGHSNSLFDGESLTLLFMGYADKVKGFDFLVDALRDVNPDISSKVVLKFASKITPLGKAKLDSLKDKYKDIILFNGYTHSDLPEICKNVNIGVVPPMWEDNLPQVTIEMVANGIPVITSNNGGAKELNSHPSFVFSSKIDFISKFETIYKNPSLLDDYWNYSAKLTTMDEHINHLKEIYSLCK